MKPRKIQKQAPCSVCGVAIPAAGRAPYLCAACREATRVERRAAAWRRWVAKHGGEAGDLSPRTCTECGQTFERGYLCQGAPGAQAARAPPALAGTLGRYAVCPARMRQGVRPSVFKPQPQTEVLFRGVRALGDAGARPKALPGEAQAGSDDAGEPSRTTREGPAEGVAGAAEGLGGMTRICEHEGCNLAAGGKVARYCAEHRAARRRRPMKWAPTSQIDEWIREEWAGPHYGRKAALVVAKRCGWPWWAVSRRAVVIGAARVTPKEKPWSATELEVLEKYAWMHPIGIQRKLRAEADSPRTCAAIVLKRKRLRLIPNLDGYTANSLAELLGLDRSTVARWCKWGQMQAQRRGSEPLEEMNRDMWWIPHSAVRKFIVAQPESIDVRKVTDSLWFIDLLTGGVIGKRNGIEGAA